VAGLQAIDTNKYPKWFKQIKGFKYESGDVEMHYKDRMYDLPDYNCQKMGLYYYQAKKMGFYKSSICRTPSNQKNQCFVKYWRTRWLRYQINNHADLQHFKKTNNEYFWIYNNSDITSNSKNEGCVM
jgi:hypothetical protein